MLPQCLATIKFYIFKQFIPITAQIPHTIQVFQTTLKATLPVISLSTRFMKRTLIYILILALLSSCRKDIDLAAGQRFVLPLVANEQECRQIQQNSIVFNCFQEIEFQDNNRVTVMVTDIINTGRYKHRAKHIIIEFDQAYDVENKMKLEIVDNNTIRYKGRDFKRWKGPGGWDLY